MSGHDTASLLMDFRRAIDGKIAADLRMEAAAAENLRARIVPLVRAALSEARGAGLCREAWLFGSYAWGAPGERSDIDVLVAGSSDPMAIASIVGRATGLDVHVVAFETAPDSLRRRVLAEGGVL